MMNAAENTVIPMSGNAWLNYSIICHWLQLSKDNSSVCMAACLLPLKLWIISERWRECRKSLMKDPCATCSGLILMTDRDGGWIPEVQGTHLAKILLSSSTTQTTWKWSHVLISWWCKATLQLTTRMYRPFSLLPTIATAAETKQPSWMWTRTWDKTIFSMTLLLAKAMKWRRKESQIIFCDRTS